MFTQLPVLTLLFAILEAKACRKEQNNVRKVTTLPGGWEVGGGGGMVDVPHCYFFTAIPNSFM